MLSGSKGRLKPPLSHLFEWVLGESIEATSSLKIDDFRLEPGSLRNPLVGARLLASP